MSAHGCEEYKFASARDQLLGSIGSFLQQFERARTFNAQLFDRLTHEVKRIVL